MDSKLVVEQMCGQLEDQAPRHAAAGAGGQPARAVRDDVHLGAARAEQARRPARQRGARRDARRRHRRAGSTSSTRSGRGRVADRGDREPGSDAGPHRGWAAARRAGHHAGAGAARRHPAHGREALLRRARQRQPRPQRRGPRPGPRDRRLAGAAGRARSTPWSPRRYAAPASPPRSSPSVLGLDVVERARLRRDGVRRLGRADLRRGRASGTRTSSTPGSARSTSRPGEGSRSGQVREAGARRARSGCSTAHAGKTVVVVSHVTPIKTLVAHAVDAPLESVFRMELSTGVGDASCRSSVTARTTSAARCGSTTPGSRRGQLLDPQRW